MMLVCMDGSGRDFATETEVQEMAHILNTKIKSNSVGPTGGGHEGM